MIVFVRVWPNTRWFLRSQLMVRGRTPCPSIVLEAHKGKIRKSFQPMDPIREDDVKEFLAELQEKQRERRLNQIEEKLIFLEEYDKGLVSFETGADSCDSICGAKQAVWVSHSRLLVVETSMDNF